MKINEVEDSSKSWASLQGINLEQYIAELADTYKKTLTGIHYIASIHHMLSSEQLNAVLGTTSSQVNTFNQQVGQFEQTIHQLSVNDPDLDAIVLDYKAKAEHLLIIAQKL